MWSQSHPLPTHQGMHRELPHADMCCTGLGGHEARPDAQKGLRPKAAVRVPRKQVSGAPVLQVSTSGEAAKDGREAAATSQQVRLTKLI